MASARAVEEASFEFGRSFKTFFCLSSGDFWIIDVLRCWWSYP